MTVRRPALVPGPLQTNAAWSWSGWACRDAAPPLAVGSMFTGCGGLDLGAAAALGGAQLAWCADPDPHVRAVLAERLPGVPNLGDITGIDWRAVPRVDVITAGWPCQDISAAGRRAGLVHGERSGLWRHIPQAVAVLRPAMVVLENVAALRWRGGGLGLVLDDLAGVGYDCLWTTVRASDVGAAHRRERVFLLAIPAPMAGAAAARLCQPAWPARPGRRGAGRGRACPATASAAWPRTGRPTAGAGTHRPSAAGSRSWAGPRRSRPTPPGAAASGWP